jgi:hypothetical protein
VHEAKREEHLGQPGYRCKGERGCAVHEARKEEYRSKPGKGTYRREGGRIPK